MPVSLLPLKKKHGFSVVEVLVAIGLLSLLVMGVTAAMSNVFKGADAAIKSLNRENTLRSISVALSNNQFCTKALFGPAGHLTLSKNWASVEVQKIQLAGETIAETGTVREGIRILGMNLKKIDGPFPVKRKKGDELQSASRYMAELTVKPRKENGEGLPGGAELKATAFYVALIVADDTSKIESCFGGADVSFFEEQCEMGFGGVFDWSQNPWCITARWRLGFNHQSPKAGFGLLQQDGEAGPASIKEDFFIEPAEGHQAFVKLGPRAAMSIRNETDQASLFLSGAGDFRQDANVNETFAALYLTSNAADRRSNGWVWAMKDYKESTISPFLKNAIVLQRTGGGATQPYAFAAESNGSPAEIHVGIASNPDPSVNVVLGGNARVTGDLSVGGTVTALSDRSLKRNIRALPPALDKILRLQPISFEWMNRTPLNEQPREVGFIAQEVQKEFPEVIRRDGDGRLGIAYGNLLSPVVKAIQEIWNHQEKEFQKIQNELDELKAAVRKCESRSVQK